MRSRYVTLFTFVIFIAASVVAQPPCTASDQLHSNHFGLSGQDGIFFDITATNTVTIECFESYFTTGGNNMTNMEIWYRPGTHIGFETNSTNWTYINGITGFPVGPTQNILLHLPIDVDVTIPAGQTYGFYITNGAIGTSSLTGIRYDGSGNLGSVTASDGNIAIHDGAGSWDKWVIYSGSRIFSGQVNYSTGSTGVNELKMAAFSLFPNPTKGIIQIDLVQYSKPVFGQVHDATGKLLFELNLNAGMINDLDLHQLENGVYFLTLRSGKTISYQKLIKH